MKSLLAAVALLALLSGCASSPSLLSYFPPADTLPEGVVPLAESSAEYRLANQTLRMDGNPGRVGLIDSFTQGQFSNVTDLYLWLLDDAQGASTFAVVVVQFRDAADADAAAGLAEPSKACRSAEATHALRDGLVFILVTGARTDEGDRPAEVVDSIANTIQVRTGAQRLC